MLGPFDDDTAARRVPRPASHRTHGGWGTTMAARITLRAAVAGALAAVTALVGMTPAGADTRARRPPQVEIVDLTPLLTEGEATARVVNERGVVAGVVSGDAFEQRVFRWHRGTFTELGHRGGNSDAESINDRGQIAGWSDALGGPRHAVVWQPDGTLVDLDPDGPYSRAQVINRRGTVLGEAGADPLSSRAVLWRDGVLLETAPDALPAFFGADLNDRDVAVVNVRDETTDVTGPVLWDDGEVIPLPLVDAPRGALGRLLNDRGVVAGRERGDPSGAPSQVDGVVWDGTQVVTIAPGAEVSVTGINDRGDVVGHVGECGQCRRTAFVFRGGELTMLPALGGPDRFSRALAVNERGQVVGDSHTADFGVHATLWDGDRVIDLGSLGGDSQAVDVNRRGHVVGWSEDDEGTRHAVLWVVRR